MSVTRCQPTTPPAASTLWGQLDSTPAGFDELGQIVPELLLEPRGPGSAAPAWPLGPFDTTATLVEALVRALEARDPYTLGHSIRVGRLAQTIAKELGCSPSEQDEIRLAGALHDIGKIGIEDALLKSDGPLSPDGYRRILDHTVIGERILQPIFRQRPIVLQVARSHHERFDGTGLPDRLRGSTIPLAARIMAVADSFDAMTSARAYRDALPLKVATWELANGAGSQFDPDCVAALLSIIARERGERRRELRQRRSKRRVDIRRWSMPSSVHCPHDAIRSTAIPVPDQDIFVDRHSGFW